MLFPSTPAGNAALCRYLASLDAMPKNAATQEQILAQIPTLIAVFMEPSPDEIYNGLGNITSPTLMLAGSQDAMVALGNSLVLVERIPGASLLQYADAGHAAILQHDSDAPAFINVFLNGQDVPASSALAPGPARATSA